MVHALEVLPGGSAGPLAAGFEVAYIAPDGTELRRPLAVAWAVSFEHAAPVRTFASYRRQRALPGLWWSVTAAGHIGYESWLERDHVMLLDFDPAVVGIASQPFWSSADGRPLSHVPDFFAHRDDGSAVVLDCRPAERRRPRDWVKFETTEAACAEVGWEFRLAGARTRSSCGTCGGWRATGTPGTGCYGRAPSGTAPAPTTSCRRRPSENARSSKARQPASRALSSFRRGSVRPAP
ncbi:TnsA-like heteromeric transposase endonuclease subunit [Streptomyces sp. NPDC018045]|uniref:TnsA-like heteromeric transposase endonuclease subunit n=1 Tax=Streptomyces sp. NPDC018045 TaxID=3365037 RepID=UPI0037883DF2